MRGGMDMQAKDKRIQEPGIRNEELGGRLRSYALPDPRSLIPFP
jgi:hypothetical protein